MMKQAIAATLRGLGHRIWTLRCIAQIAPGIGLFGTCIGIPNAFRMFCGSTQTGLSCIGSGFLEALVPAALGVLTGTLAGVAHQYCEQRIQEFATEMQCASMPETADSRRGIWSL